MAFPRWDPIGDVFAIRRRLGPLISGPTGWVPPVDLYETATAYVLIAELPGIGRDDLHIEVHDGVLTLSGVRRERTLSCEQYHRVERGHGAFMRTFGLPAPVDTDRVSADLRDGVLTILCPKASEVPGRRVPVS